MTHEEVYNSLIEKIRLYHPRKDLSLIEKAYRLALEAHGDQLRKSGEPYIIHPLTVAVILSELGLDMESLVAGILHDVIEDTQYEYEDIVEMFGEEIASLVDGVTKLDKIEYIKQKDEKPANDEEEKARQKISRSEELQAENYRKMFLAMAKDIRIIMIKIADRLHNMRTLNYMKPEKQLKKAQETLDIYAPLAHRLGISKIRCELEDLSLKYLNKEVYYDLAEKISRKQVDRQRLVEEMVVNIKNKMDEVNITATVNGRPKHFFSIYKKMLKKSMNLEQMYDLFALRIIVNSVSECYEILGIIHEMYRPIQGRFKDYISMAKPNMYQSLHTTIIGVQGEPFEIQIKTWEMHRVAEYGIAAHWKYKEDSRGVVNPGSEEAKLTWLRQILEWQRDLSDNKQYLSELKTELNMFKGSIYCFTPKGKVVRLVIDSTPIDFAYAIHSAIGNTMVGARVNSTIVPFDYKLKTGDRVEIVVSRNSKGPKSDWLKHVQTTQARNRIKNWLKYENKEESISKAREMLETLASKENLFLKDLITSDTKKLILKKYNYMDWDTFLASVGRGSIRQEQVLKALIDINQEGLKSSTINSEDTKHLSISDNSLNKDKKSGVIVQGIGDVFVRFSKCCNPLPGEEIVGFVTRGRGISVHRTDCKNIIVISQEDKSRLVEVEWETNVEVIKNVKYTVGLKIECEDRPNLMLDISRVLSEFKISIKNMNARSNNSTAIFEILLEVESKEQLDSLCNKVFSVQSVCAIERIVD